jgi:hypothetical protein
MTRYFTNRDHILYFGVIGEHGLNQSGITKLEEMVKKYERIFFTGPRSGWLYNIALVAYEGTYPKEMEPWFFPRGSTYFEYLTKGE